MYTDLLGRKRMKINLHLHTTLSDGQKTPEEAAALYRAAGYDVLAVTDHWKYLPSGEISGLRIISGIEFNTITDGSSGANGAGGVYHIVGLGCKEEPKPDKNAGPQEMIDAVNSCGGLAVLAHPAWSMNTVCQAKALHGIGATEIYNSCSNAHNSCRPYAGMFVDIAAGQGMLFPLLATDDVHYYDGTDETQSFIMLECDENASDDDILQAIRDKKFYASQGPEIHLSIEGDDAVVRCSPASRISFLSNVVVSAGHGHFGDGLTEARCPLRSFETFIRAEVTDAHGRKAWSNCIDLKNR